MSSAAYRLRAVRPIVRITLLCAVVGGAACDDSTATSDPRPDVGDTSSRDGSPADSAATDTTVGTDTPGDIDVGSLDFGSVEVVANPANALSVFVTWRTAEPTAARLRLACDGEEVAVMTTDEERDRHEAFVMGIIPEVDCTVTVTATAMDGRTGTAQRAYRVDELPAFLPPTEILAARSEQVQPGWTLFNLNNHFDEIPMIAAIVDAQGRYRWYHRVSSTHSGSDNEVAVTERGVLIGGTRGQIWPALVSWAGTTEWSEQLVMHHDARLLPDGDTLAYLVDEGDCGTGFNAGGIDEWSISGDEVVWSWKICEHFVPDELESDWSHINTVEPVGDVDAYIISSRNQHLVLRVDRTSGEIDWKLGEGGDFTMETDDWFYRQHAPQWLGDGRILLFDNGSESRRAFSRAVEYRLDTNSMTAEKSWEFAPDPAIFTPIWGDADRLENGNTLVTFGHRSTTERSRVIEVDRDGQTTWDLALPPRWGIYRADRIAPPTLITFEE